MRKSTVIAQCIINSNFDTDVSSAEKIVHDHFDRSFSDSNFDTWNSELDLSTSNNIIEIVGAASSINVESFIRDLWDA